MTKGLKVTKIGFDNLENRDGEVIEEEKVFIDDAGETAYKKAGKWLSSLPPEHRYIGWDLKVYPMFSIEQIEVN